MNIIQISPKLCAKFFLAFMLLPGLFLSVNLLSAYAQGPNDDLVGYWAFDEGSGTSASDSSGNSNTGTLTNTPCPGYCAP